MVSFKISSEDLKLVRQIVERTARLAETSGFTIDERSLEMDLVAVHANGCPLDFDRLAKPDDANLGHDVFGIRRHIDRSTGELTRHFLPRCAKPLTAEEAAA